MTPIIRSASEPSCPNKIAYLQIKRALKKVSQDTYNAAMAIFNETPWYMAEASSSYHTYSEQILKGTQWKQKASRLIQEAAAMLSASNNRRHSDHSVVSLGKSGF